MEGAGITDVQGAAAAALTQMSGRQGIPVSLVKRGIFERAVLNHFRIQSAVSGIIQVFKKDPEKAGTDGLSLFIGRNGHSEGLSE